MNYISKISLLIIIIFFGKNNYAQTSITLEKCYQLLNQNFPLLKQQSLLKTQNELALDLLNTEKNPKIDLSAQATYQSDVIGLPFATITPPNKDQYRATVSINQLIYAGGSIDANKKVKQAELKTQQKQVEVTIYQLKKKINQLYLSLLLLDDKKLLLNTKKDVLNSKLQEIKAGIKNGVIIPTSDAIIASEILKVKQQILELKANQKVVIANLSILIGQPLNNTTLFINPKEIATNTSSGIQRPELDLFLLKKEQLDASEIALSKQKAPKIMGFATSGYGNPGLNMLDNSFQGFYTLGVQLNWNIFDWNATKKQQQILHINKDIIDSEKEVFNLNTQIDLQQEISEIEKLKSFIKLDNDIIALRKTVLKSVEAQLKNDVVTPSTYITELSNLFEAQNNLSIHKKQLKLAKINYNTIKGN